MEARIGSRPEPRLVTTWEGKVRVRVLVAGDGPPLVYLHGPAGLVWDAFLDALSGTHRVYAPEHPGTSAEEPDAIKALDDLWDLVLHYYEVFDQLGLSAPAVVGHSFGGMVAAELAATCPDRVGKLVLIDPLGLWREDAPVADYMTMTREELARAQCLDPTGPVCRQLLALPEDEEARKDEEIRWTWAMGCTSKFVWPIPDRGLRKRLHRITAPTLLVWGSRDAIVPAVYAEDFGARIPRSRVAILEEAGHLPQLEQLGPTIRLVRDFLGTGPEFLRVGGGADGASGRGGRGRRRTWRGRDGSPSW